MLELIGKIVEVGTVEVIYIGKLIEMTDESIDLESESGWISIPMDRVAYMREAEQD